MQKNSDIGRNTKLLKQQGKWQTISMVTVSKISSSLWVSFLSLSLHVGAEQSSHEMKGDCLDL